MTDEFAPAAPAGPMIPTPDVVPELHESFRRFVEAALEDDLERLDRTLTGAAIARGRDLREATLSGSREKLEALDPYTQACVLGFRATFARDALESLGYAGYFAYALAFFPGGRTFLEGLEIGNIIAAKDDEEEFFAGQLVFQGEEPDLAIRFFPDGGGWRVDPVAIHALYAQLTGALVEQNFGGNAEKFLDAYINDVFKPEDFESLWEPVAS